MKKRLGIILLAISLFFGMFPQTALSAESTTFDRELALYLTEVSNERGFTVTREDLEVILGGYGMDLSSYSSVDEIRSGFGEVIKADYSNLNGIYENYGLDLEALTQLLAENGEELSDYIFLNELEYTVYFYMDGLQEPGFEQKLTEYLAEISAQRGFEITKEALVTNMGNYGATLEYFQTVDELRDSMGEVVRADYSNLSTIYEEYDLDEASLLLLLEKNGKSMNDYIYVDALYLDVSIYNGEIFAELFEDPEMAGIFASLDITREEFQNLISYLYSYSTYFLDPAFTGKILALGEEISGFEELDEENMTPAQVEEILALLEEYFQLFKLTPVFLLNQDGKEVPLFLSEVYSIAEQDPMELVKNGGITIAFYGEASQLLMDIKITEDFIASMNEVVDAALGETVDEMKAAVEEPELQLTAPDKQAVSASRTENGGKLPKTAANYLPNAVIGFFLLLTGILMNKKVKDVKKEAASC